MKFVGWKLFYTSLALTVPFFVFAITRIVRSTQFDDGCTYHIQQALDSDDSNYSTAQVDTAIEYLKIHNLTNGYTTIAGKSANEDLGLWYKKILEKDEYIHTLNDLSAEDLKKYKEYVSYREMKSMPVFVPEGISVYPHNVLFFIWELISIVLAVLGIAGIIVFVNEKASA